MRSRSKPLSIISSPSPNQQSYAESLSTKLDNPSLHKERFKRDLLVRDDFKCVITGHIDQNRYKELGLEAPDLNPIPVERVYIIPFSYGFWNPERVKSLSFLSKLILLI